jgi:hypothetical protein
MKTKILLILLALLPILIAAQPAEWLEESDYKNQRNGKFVKDSTYFFDWSILELNWLNVERQKVTERDQYGNQTKSVNVLWDATNSAWVDSRRQELFWYDSVSLHFLRAFIWDSKAEDWKLSDSIYHNTSKKPVISWFKVWDLNKFRFTRGKRVYYHYSGDNLLTREDISVFDTLSGNWLDNEIVSYNHNENGLVHQKTIKKWKENQAWIDTLRYTYSYNELSQNTGIFLESWNENGFWQNISRTDWYYNASGSPDAIFNFKWNSPAQAWDSTFISQYSYDQQDRLEEVLQVQWDTFYNGWINHSKTNTYYNEQGQRSSRLQQFWDPFGSYWFNVSNYSYTYDADGNQLDNMFQFWDEDSEVWLNMYKETNWWSFFEPAVIPENELLQITISPNPASDFIHISIDEPFTNGRLTIYSNGGTPVINRSISIPSERIDVSGLQKGIYFLQITIDGKMAIRKVVVG